MSPTRLQIEPTSLCKYRYFESSDLDDTRQRIASVFQPHRLTPGPGRHRNRSHMDYVRLDKLALGSLAYTGAMTVEAGEIEDYFLVIFSLSGYADVSVNGRRLIISPSRGVVLGPSANFGGTFSGDCEQFFLRVDKEALLMHCGSRQLQIEPTLDLTRPELAPWLAYLRLLTSSPETLELAQRDRRIASEVERMLITLLLAGQPHHSRENAVDSLSLPRTVRRAESFIAEHACDALTLNDIAQAAGVPVRTLLHSFQRYRGVSPMHLVREARLDKSRQMLLRATETERVTDIALGCGFINLGRFASAYRKKFNETPSETLRKLRHCSP